MNIKRESGFTLIEVMAVIIIIGILSVIVIPKLTSSTINARQKADIATAHQVKAALDRYQIENGKYPDDLKESDGAVTSASLIPKYISKLDASTTQQVVPDGKEGFGISTILESTDNYSIPDTAASAATNIIMIYLSSDGLAAEVRAYDDTLKKELWTSAN